MIWGNVKYIDHYKGISHALDVALDYLAAGDFKELENGKLDLDNMDVAFQQQRHAPYQFHTGTGMRLLLLIP